MREIRRRRDPTTGCRDIARTIAGALADAGRVGRLPDESIQVQQLADAGEVSRFRITVQGPPQDRRMIADAVAELFDIARTPRFLLAVGRGTGRSATGRDHRVLLPVPQAIARRRADAERFAARWAEMIGPCTLLELQGDEGLRLLRLARSQRGMLAVGAPRTTLWG